MWAWLVRERDIASLSALRRRDVAAYMEARLASGRAASTVNRELTNLWGLLRYAEEQGYTVAPSIFRVKPLKLPQRVPRFLSEVEYQRLEQAVLKRTAAGRRNDRLDRAWFYLLAHAGLRLQETCDLRLGDVDLVGQRLIVRQGKGKRDRALPLSTTLAAVLEAYLAVRGPASSDHLLIFRQKAIGGWLIQERLRQYGKAVKVQVSPHRLRHTVATRLLNQGMPITSLQRILGHEKLETTMVYAYVHDQTVRADFEDAMGRLSRVMVQGEELLPGEAEQPLIREEINYV
jgi:site-specific recombinase XerD